MAIPIPYTYWMVMSAVTITAANRNSARCFELNATNLATEDAAKAEADRRNAIEQAAGHNNVLWYSCPQYDFELYVQQLENEYERRLA